MFFLCIPAVLSLVHERSTAAILPVQWEVPVIATVSKRSHFSSPWVRSVSVFLFPFFPPNVLSGEKTCAFSALFALFTGSSHLVLNSYWFCLFFKEKQLLAPLFVADAFGCQPFILKEFPYSLKLTKQYSIVKTCFKRKLEIIPFWFCAAVLVCSYH